MSDEDELADLIEWATWASDDIELEYVSANDRLDRMVEEILNPVDVYVEGKGPEGPWHYRSLTVLRVYKDIDVYDVDGDLYAALQVPDATRDDVTDDLEGQLRAKLDELNEESLEEL